MAFFPVESVSYYLIISPFILLKHAVLLPFVERLYNSNFSRVWRSANSAKRFLSFFIVIWGNITLIWSKMNTNHIRLLTDLGCYPTCTWPTYYTHMQFFLIYIYLLSLLCSCQRRVPYCVALITLQTCFSFVLLIPKNTYKIWLSVCKIKSIEKLDCQYWRY